jgi:two-component system sensor histidine kinase MprB
VPFIGISRTMDPQKFLAGLPHGFLGEGGGGYGYQLVRTDGAVARAEYEDVALPTGPRARAAAGGGRPYFSDSTVRDTHVRVFTEPFAQGWALQVARPLSEIDASLARVRTLLFLVVFGGVAMAALLGTWVARTALTPVRRLTRATEHVTQTGDLAGRIDAGGRDELSRLAASFNTMLAALEEAARAQRQLVADASHELRTPLTSLRTNIEVLARDRTMADDDREQLLHDVVEQIEEMSDLVSELVELTRGDAPHPAEPEEVRLDLLAADAIERAQRHRPGVTFTADLEPTTVQVVPSRVERAVANLLDNAGKWSPPGAEIGVGVHDGEVTVRDHGPGIADADLPFVFDRFYRAAAARGLPGSGLGLAIVRQVADEHGGEVVVERPPGGGTLMRLRFAPADVPVAS